MCTARTSQPNAASLTCNIRSVSLKTIVKSIWSYVRWVDVCLLCSKHLKSFSLSDYKTFAWCEGANIRSQHWGGRGSKITSWRLAWATPCLDLSSEEKWGQGWMKKLKRLFHCPRRHLWLCSLPQLLVTMDCCHCNRFEIHINGIIYYILFSQGLQPLILLW